MTKEEKASARAKKIQCAIGLFFLIPPILGVLAFVFCLLGSDGSFSEMRDLSEPWTTRYGYDRGGGGGMSAAPIYLGLMAMTGAYLIKDSLKYFFMGEEKPQKEGLREEPKE